MEGTGKLHLPMGAPIGTIVDDQNPHLVIVYSGIDTPDNPATENRGVDLSIGHKGKPIIYGARPLGTDFKATFIAPRLDAN